MLNTFIRLNTALRQSLFTVFIVMAACANADTQPQNPQLRYKLEPVTCWFDTEYNWPFTDCFYFHINENHHNPLSLVVKIPVIRFSRGPTIKNPVLDLGAGGPGMSAGLEPDVIDSWVWENLQYLSLERGRDLYVIDPRGVGMAKPLLVCDEYIATVIDTLKHPLTRAQESNRGFEVDKKCHQRWQEKGHDFTQYNSRVVAQDIELLRKALGVYQWNLLGVSYASRYALTYARDFPESVEAMVLDGAVFPHLAYFENQVTNDLLAFEKAFDRCRNKTKCQQQYPDIDARFWQLIENLNRAPLIIDVLDSRGRNGFALALTGDRLYDILFESLYDPMFHQKLPHVIASLEKNNTRVIQPEIQKYVDFILDRSFADVVRVSHYCYETYPFINQVTRLENAKFTNDYLERRLAEDIQFEKRWCELWLGNQKAHESESNPIHTTIPTLFLHGALDPILPVEDLTDQMPLFKNGVKEVFNHLSHSIIFSSLCAEKKAGAFFDNASLYYLNTGCEFQIQH